MSIWRDDIKIHPAAELFPRMSGEEMKVFRENIENNGMKVPIVILYSKDRRFYGAGLSSLMYSPPSRLPSRYLQPQLPGPAQRSQPHRHVAGR